MDLLKKNYPALSIPKLVFIFILAPLFCGLLPPVARFAAVADAAAYGAQRRPYSCFMKNLAVMTTDDFKPIDNLAPALSSNAPTDEETGEIYECGRAVYEKYGAQIDSLIKDFDALFNAKTAFPSQSQYMTARFDDKTIDFNYTRSLARSLVTAGRYLEFKKRYEEALKLYTLAWRFGQIVMSGDGGVPTLVMAMIGIAVKNIAAENNLTRVLLAGNFDAKFYDDYSSALQAKLDDEMDMKAIMNCERWIMINCLEYEVFVVGKNHGDFGDIVNKIPQSKMEEAKRYTIGIFNDSYDSVGVWLTKHAAEPDIVGENVRKMLDEISRKGQPSLWSFVSPVKAVGDMMLAIAMPNFSRSYEHFIRAKYYPYGAVALGRVLAFVKRGGGVPKTLEELEKACGFKLMKDFFNRSRGPLQYKLIGDEYALYSFGMNYTDDNAHAKDDVVLFRIPKNLK